MTNKKVSEKKIQKVNKILGVNWENTTYHSYTDMYGGLQKTDDVKNSCSGIFEAEFTPQHRRCPHYLRECGYCLYRSYFILNPKKTTCSLHPVKRQYNYISYLSQLKDFHIEFEKEEYMDLDKLNWYMDCLKDLAFDHFASAIDTMGERSGDYRKEYLEFAFNFHAEIYHRIQLKAEQKKQADWDKIFHSQ